MDQNHPQIYLYGQNSTGDDQSAKVSIAYSRERGDRRGDPAEGEWICKIVRICLVAVLVLLLTLSSAVSTIGRREIVASNAKLLSPVRNPS